MNSNATGAAGETASRDLSGVEIAASLATFLPALAALISWFLLTNKMSPCFHLFSNADWQQWAGWLGPDLVVGVVAPVAIGIWLFVRHRWSVLLAVAFAGLVTNALLIYPMFLTAIFYSRPGAC
ncbi:MAG: hypothetical protein K8T20_14105 [Planctomycetes bacterium]|nr:hypothetical protein [Planctomycetota bacterium]